MTTKNIFASRNSSEQADWDNFVKAEQAVTEALNVFRLPFGDNERIGALESDGDFENRTVARYKKDIIKQASHAPFFSNVPIEKTVNEFLEFLSPSEHKKNLRDQTCRDLLAALSQAASKAAGVGAARG